MLIFILTNENGGMAKCRKAVWKWEVGRGTLRLSLKVKVGSRPAPTEGGEKMGEGMING